MSWATILQYLSVISIVGGGVFGYNEFHLTKMDYKHQQKLIYLSDSLATQKAKELIPYIDNHVEKTMVKAGLVDYDLIFKHDSIALAQMYHKLNASANQQAVAATTVRIENEKASFRDERIGIIINNRLVVFKWVFNPKSNRWDLQEE